MPPVPKRPKLTNRGGAGLYGRVSRTTATVKVTERIGEQKREGLDNIVPALHPHAVPIDSLVPDPLNARLHPERNLEAIKQSLLLYRQCSPLVVNKANNHVIIGNGRLSVAKGLGWSHIAAIFLEVSEVEAAGLGLADNRSAELAKWDFEIVARLDRLMTEKAGVSNMVGWNVDELSVLRMVENWVPPPVSDSLPGENGTLTLKWARGEGENVRQVLERLLADAAAEERDAGTPEELLDGVCKQFLEGKVG